MVAIAVSANDRRRVLSIGQVLRKLSHTGDRLLNAYATLLSSPFVTNPRHVQCGRLLHEAAARAPERRRELVDLVKQTIGE
ncbi:MAG: hypothetical protein FD171_642 [Actinobacteria bacterium]|nr:MAG: hypothetical protein FD171_642 [Actinomycetota bacterium]